MAKRGHIKISDLPDLLAEWDWEKNTKDPSVVSRGAVKKYWWICKKGHSFDMSPNSRTNKSKSQSCPYCSGKRVLKGSNDLATIHPEVEPMWDWDKNSLSPYEIPGSSKKRIYLKCENGHQFTRIPANSLGSVITCRQCSGYQLTWESSVAGWIGANNDLWSKKNSTPPSEVKANEKSTKYWWVCELGHLWAESPHNQLKRLKGDDWCPFCSNRKLLVGFNDLESTHPDIAHLVTTENPRQIISTSTKRISFTCPEYKDHVFMSSPLDMCNGRKCPYCTGRSVKVGFNDFATVHPDLATKVSASSEVKPHQITAGSNKKLTFNCDNGHTYQSSAKNASIGYGCPYCSSRKLSKENSIQITHPDIAKRFSSKSKHSPSEVSIGSHKKVMLICKNNSNHFYEISCGNIIPWDSCPHCPRNNDSTPENEIVEYVRSIIDCSVIQRDTKFLGGRKELDIYIPDRKIAVEFNGLYWHTESAGKDRSYHYSKWRKCRDRGIQLITVWEDEWRDKRPIIEKMLAHKLGVSEEIRTFARKTTVVELDSAVAREFCDTHHIQGSANGSVYLGLENDSGELVAVSVWCKNGTTLYLDRYCTSTTVIGGMGKLLKAGKAWARNNNCYRIVTFADHQVSDGNLYETLGFTKDKELPPDYKYVVGGRRKHKFGYRLKRFQSDPKLLYKPGYTETQLAQLNGLERVWDCGKTRYVMEV